MFLRTFAFVGFGLAFVISCAPDTQSPASQVSAAKPDAPAKSIDDSLHYLEDLRRHFATLSNLKAESDSIDSLYRGSVKAIETIHENLQALVVSLTGKSSEGSQQTYELIRAQMSSARLEFDYLETFRDVMESEASGKTLELTQAAMLRSLTALEDSIARFLN